VFGALTARRSGRSASITTEDGSLGARGAVTDLLEPVIREARTDVIYGCAPVPVLREVTAIATRYDIPVQASVDVPMACGTGVCMGCVLPVTGTDGITRIVRSCVDGPVFRGDLVRWDDVGTIPFDALGAPGWSGGPRGVWESGHPSPRGVRGDGSPRENQQGGFGGDRPPGVNSHAG
jgi:dihydroorotate dehydrogenase electron transfer subunit